MKYLLITHCFQLIFISQRDFSKTQNKLKTPLSSTQLYTWRMLTNFQLNPVIKVPLNFKIFQFLQQFGRFDL